MMLGINVGPFLQQQTPVESVKGKNKNKKKKKKKKKTVSSSSAKEVKTNPHLRKESPE